MSNRDSHSHHGESFSSCRSRSHWSRRSWLHSMAWGGACWLTPLAETLGRIHDDDLHRDSKAARDIRKSVSPAKSLIVLWLQGAPSQLETFDPHPDTKIAAGSKAIKTNVEGVQLSDNLPGLAERMDRFSIVRTMTSEEGDHERAIRNILTGHRPEPTLEHPSLGSVICHQTESRDGVIEIPRHVSILPSNLSSRGGYLGPQYDAFRTYDPNNKVPDIQAWVEDDRFKRRMDALTNVAEQEFMRGRLAKQELLGTQEIYRMAQRMMSSEQVAAFDVTNVSANRQAQYGNTAFGRGCIAATQLIQAGVRCVEVTLQGWDSHAENHSTQKARCETLDPAVCALLDDLEEQDLLSSTMVLVAGEFGRTPRLNGLDGRDHWPHGFSIALAGGGIQGGRVIGATPPDPAMEKEEVRKQLVDPHPVEDLHATILHQMGIDYQQEYQTPIGRPMQISEGKVIEGLL